MNINIVALSGNLTRDPEVKDVGSQSLAKLRLAVNKGVKDADGSWHDEPMYFDVNVWGRMADVCGRFLSKGSKVTVSGRLDWREWTNDSGEKRQFVAVVADKVEFPSKREAEQQRESAPPDPARDPVMDELAAAFPNSTVLPDFDGDDQIPF